MRCAMWMARMGSASRTILMVAALVSAIGPARLTAQPRASERATVRQVVNGTTITLDFARPVARGRENLFGRVVHPDELWTPGANWATTLEVDRPVTLDGHPLAPGKYSVWLETHPDRPWRIGFHRSCASTTTPPYRRTDSRSAST